MKRSQPNMQLLNTKPKTVIDNSIIHAVAIHMVRLSFKSFELFIIYHGTSAAVASNHIFSAKIARHVSQFYFSTCPSSIVINLGSVLHTLSLNVQDVAAVITET